MSWSVRVKVKFTMMTTLCTSLVILCQDFSSDELASTNSTLATMIATLSKTIIVKILLKLVCICLIEKCIKLCANVQSNLQTISFSLFHLHCTHFNRYQKKCCNIYWSSVWKYLLHLHSGFKIGTHLTKPRPVPVLHTLNVVFHT